MHSSSSYFCLKNFFHLFLVVNFELFSTDDLLGILRRSVHTFDKHTHTHTHTHTHSLTHTHFFISLIWLLKISKFKKNAIDLQCLFVSYSLTSSLFLQFGFLKTAQLGGILLINIAQIHPLSLSPSLSPLCLFISPPSLPILHPHRTSSL